MKSKAFTLVELLVVMAIISFLSVGAFAGLSFGLRQARDTQRKKIVDLTHIALQAYYSDYMSYPSCSGAAAVPGMPNWKYCPEAFPAARDQPGTLVYEPAPAGFKEYLEGEWPVTSGQAAPGTSNDTLRYYMYSSSGKASKFAVCISLENSKGGNVKRANDKTDCYCVGSDYTDLECKGMKSISN